MANEMTTEQMNNTIKKHCEQFDDCFDCKRFARNVEEMCHNHQWYIGEELHDDDALMQIVREINKAQ